MPFFGNMAWLFGTHLFASPFWSFALALPRGFVLGLIGSLNTEPGFSCAGVLVCWLWSRQGWTDWTFTAPAGSAAVRTLGTGTSQLAEGKGCRLSLVTVFLVRMMMLSSRSWGGWGWERSARHWRMHFRGIGSRTAGSSFDAEVQRHIILCVVSSIGGFNLAVLDLVSLWEVKRNLVFIHFIVGLLITLWTAADLAGLRLCPVEMRTSWNWLFFFFFNPMQFGLPRWLSGFWLNTASSDWSLN